LAQKGARASCSGDWTESALFLLCGVNDAGRRLEIWGPRNWRKLCNEELQNLGCSPNIASSSKMRRLR